MSRLLFIVFLLLLNPIFGIHAQTPNDNIENAIYLEHDQPFSSKTHGCTIQWSCVDESLTGKCIDYHNDQWFIFNAESYSKLYVNVGNQRCRDLRGVQIVVLKGEPCNVETYQVFKCVSLVNQDDIYIELDSLQKNENYYINIDGYLHDYCFFEIEVSQKPKGFPIDQELVLYTYSNRNKNLVRIDWELPDALFHQVDEFQIFRKTASAFKHEFVANIPLISNVYGDISGKYYFEDSIAANIKYHYKLTVRANSGRLLFIDNYQFYYQHKQKEARFLRYINIPIENVRNKDSISIIIYDYATNTLLASEVMTYKKKDPTYTKYNTYKAIQKGADKLLVKVVNNTSKSTKEYTFDLWDD